MQDHTGASSNMSYKVQPLDVVVNREFKKPIDRLATEAMTQNPDKFLTARLTASEIRIFLPNGCVKLGKKFLVAYEKQLFVLLRNVESCCLLQGNGIT